MYQSEIAPREYVKFLLYTNENLINEFIEFAVVSLVFFSVLSTLAF